MWSQLHPWFFTNVPGDLNGCGFYTYIKYDKYKRYACSRDTASHDGLDIIQLYVYIFRQQASSND